MLLATMTEQRDKVLVLISEAKENDDHLALGYDNFATYVQAEYGDLLAGLARADRQVAVGVLADLQLSTRTIASVVGVSKSQVAEDVRQVSSSGHLDAEQEVRHQDVPDEEHPVPEVAEPVVPPQVPTAVVGRDGKTYTRPAPSPRRRRPFLDAYRDDVRDVVKVVQRLKNRHADDRFAGYREALKDRHRYELGAAAGTLAGLDTELCSGGVFPVKRGQKPISTRELRQQAEAGGSADDAPRQRSRPGANKRKHAAQLDALNMALDGALMAFDGMTELDASVTREEATRLAGDLSKYVEALDGINVLLLRRGDSVG